MAPPFLTLDPSTSPFHLEVSDLETNITPPLSPKSGTSSDSEYTDKLSPLTPSPVQHNDLSRVSGFPQASDFNFGLTNSGTSPVSPLGEHQPSDPSSANLIPARSQGSNALPGGVHREPHVGMVASEPAPPPYERYTHHSMPIGGVRASRASIAAHQFPTDFSIPAPTHVRGNHRFSSAAGAHGVPRRFSGQRQVYPLTMQPGQGGLSGNGSAKASWRIFGGEEGLDSPNEKRFLSRKGKWIIYVAAATILITVAIVGVLVGTMKPKAPAVNTGPAFDMSKFPVLPTGVTTITPQGPAETPSSSCVEPRTLWSCSLPSDSNFPTNSARDNNRVPEFTFTIALRNSTKGGDVEDSLWAPVPELVSSDAEYSSLAEVDRIVSENKIGEKTQFYLSMQTENKPITISSGEGGHRRNRKRQSTGTPAQMLPSMLRNQQLRLFDRGLDTEHYGFFVYYKKTINVLATKPEDVTELTNASDDPSGVAAVISGATEVTWKNTRFKVAIWTISAKNQIGGDGVGYSNRTGDLGDIFPYPVSIIEDRAGDKGQVYYGKSSKEKTIIEESNKDQKGCFCEWRARGRT